MVLSCEIPCSYCCLWKVSHQLKKESNNWRQVQSNEVGTEHSQGVHRRGCSWLMSVDVTHTILSTKHQWQALSISFPKCYISFFFIIQIPISFSQHPSVWKCVCCHIAWQLGVSLWHSGYQWDSHWGIWGKLCVLCSPYYTSSALLSLQDTRIQYQGYLAPNICSQEGQHRGGTEKSKWAYFDLPLLCDLQSMISLHIIIWDAHISQTWIWLIA